MKKIILAICCVAFFSCNKHKVDNSPIQSNWLIPLVKGHVSLNDLSRLEGTSYSHEITPADIGMPTNVTVSSPAFTVNHIGPFAIPTQDIIKYLKVDSLEVQMDIHNIFPINISSGFSITLRSTKDTTTATNILFSKTFSNNLGANAKDSMPLSITNVTINDSLYFYIENLHIDAFSNVVFNQNMPINFSINKVRLNELALFSNKSFSIKDTVDFSSGDLSGIYNTGNGVISDTSVTGHLNFWTDNAIPIFTNLQLTFLQNQYVRDSVFDNTFTVTGANIDALGNAIDTKSEKNSVNVIKSKLQHIEQSNKLVYSFSINTNGYTTPYIVISKNNLLGLQIVSDLKLILNPFKF